MAVSGELERLLQYAAASEDRTARVSEAERRNPFVAGVHAKAVVAVDRALDADLDVIDAHVRLGVAQAVGADARRFADLERARDTAAQTRRDTLVTAEPELNQYFAWVEEADAFSWPPATGAPEALHRLWRRSVAEAERTAHTDPSQARRDVDALKIAHRREALILGMRVAVNAYRGAGDSARQKELRAQQDLLPEKEAVAASAADRLTAEQRMMPSNDVGRGAAVAMTGHDRLRSPGAGVRPEAAPGTVRHQGDPGPTRSAEQTRGAAPRGPAGGLRNEP